MSEENSSTKSEVLTEHKWKEFDAWVKTIRREFSDFRDEVDPGDIQENKENIQHNYELIYELKDQIEELKQEITALKLVQIISLKEKNVQDRSKVTMQGREAWRC